MAKSKKKIAQPSTVTKFVVTGGFDILKSLKPREAADGGIVAYTLPDGREARLVVALEVEEPSTKYRTGTLQYVTSEKEMAKLGFEALDYEALDFYPEE